MNANALMTWMTFATIGFVAAGCTKPLEDEPYCSDDTEPLPQVSRAVTWHQDVAPIIEARCAWCHAPGEIGPFPLTTFEETYALRDRVRAEVVAGTMPPWLPADCCNDFQQDFGLTPAQIATIDAWVEQGAPEGDPADPAEPLPSMSGLSRVDVTVEMPEPYRPEPLPGRVDDFRCFLVDWPLQEEAYVTGINPRPGARQILHHLVIAVVSGDELEAAERAFEHDHDGRPGIPCEGGLGDIRVTSILGGSLLGGDFPEGLGKRVDGDSKLIYSLHYSMADAAPEYDQTAVEFKVEPQAQDYKTLVITNPMWLVSDAMLVKAGEKDKRFRYQYDPRVFTRGEPAKIWGFSPHMHYLGSSIRALVVREDGSTECLAEIPEWDFGWEQPYWFEEPIDLNPGDEVYVECTFDNTLENQPIVDGRRQEPVDIGWGTDNQDMCVAFLQYTTEDH